MKILIVHNHYRNYGGEDAVVEAEKRLLEKHGHEVILYTQSNLNIGKFSLLRKINLYFNTHWSKDSYLNIKKLILKEKPDVAHIHNTFLLITPAVYFACKDLKVPVVQTLHNYRFLCPGGELYLKGKICERCFKANNFRSSLIYGCWHKSRFLTAAAVRNLEFHKQRDTFKTLIDCNIALTEFSKNKFIEAGYPAGKITVKPNFVSFMPEAKKDKETGDYVLFVGRLSEEKGIRFLINCWGRVNHIPLKIIGDGGLYKELKAYAQKKGLNIEFLGQKGNQKVISYIKNSAFIVFPSEWYETFGKVIIESFACGIPVIASRLGAMQELVSDNKNGLLFGPGNASDFIKKVNLLWNDAKLLKRLGENAREEYRQKYTEDENYKKLIDIYTKVVR